MKKWIKRIVILMVLMVLFTGLYIGNRTLGSKKAAREVVLGAVSKGTLDKMISANGIIEPGDKIQILTEVEGNVTEKKVREGDIVKKGDILLTLDRSRLEKDLLNANVKLSRVRNNLKTLLEVTIPYERLQTKTSLEKNKIQFDYAEKNLASMRRMLSDDIISRRQLEEAERSYQSAKLDQKVSEEQAINQEKKFAKDVTEAKWEIELAEKDLAEAKDRLDKATISASISGTIVQDIVQDRKMVGAKEEIFSIGDVTRFVARVNVDEIDIGKVRPGQTVQISSDAFEKGKKLPGIVKEIASQAIRKTFSEISVTVEITDTLKQPVRPNMTVQTNILIDQLPNRLLIPVEAVVNEEDKNYVFYLKGDRVTRREVGVEASNTQYSAITSGLKLGEKIVVKGANWLNEGDMVRIKTNPAGKKKNPGKS